MLRKKLSIVSAACFATLLWTSTADATLVSPLPGVFGPDDGSTIFLPSSTVFNVEVFDALESIADTAFGFFFANDPGTLVPIFGPEDEGASFSQSAQINFLTGQVFDLDTPGVQATFTGTGAIGFWFIFHPPGAPSPVSLFSVPSLNDGGIDPVATFPALTIPLTYLIGFEGPTLTGVPVAFEIVQGITRVGEPGTLLLVGLGMGLIARCRRRG